MNDVDIINITKDVINDIKIDRADRDVFNDIYCIDNISEIL